MQIDPLALAGVRNVNQLGTPKIQPFSLVIDFSSISAGASSEQSERLDPTAVFVVERVAWTILSGISGIPAAAEAGPTAANNTAEWLDEFRFEVRTDRAVTFQNGPVRVGAYVGGRQRDGYLVTRWVLFGQQFYCKLHNDSSAAATGQLMLQGAKYFDLPGLR